MDLDGDGTRELMEERSGPKGNMSCRQLGGRERVVRTVVWDASRIERQMRQAWRGEREENASVMVVMLSHVGETTPMACSKRGSVGRGACREAADLSRAVERVPRQRWP